MLSRNLQYPASIANGTTDSTVDPNGARHGVLGGQNEDGPDILFAQAIHGTFSIIQNPFKSTKEFVEAITTAVSQKRTAVILDPKVLTKEIAEKLAENPSEAEVKQAIKGEIVESYGKAMGPSLAEAGVIMPYSRAQVFTRGWEGKLQAHHLLEANMAEKTMLKLDAKAINDIPAIVLSEAEHKEITKSLNEARARILPGVNLENMQPHDLWKVYQEVYAKNPAWLDAIKHYFP